MNGVNMAIRYKMDVLAALKAAGYSSTRIRNEKLIGQATLQQLRHGEIVSWATINTICRLDVYKRQGRRWAALPLFLP